MYQTTKHTQHTRRASTKPPTEAPTMVPTGGVCVRERGREGYTHTHEREREKERDRERERERE